MRQAPPSQITRVSISALFYLDESFLPGIVVFSGKLLGGVGGGSTFYFLFFTCVPSRRDFFDVYLPLCESICDPRDIKAPRVRRRTRRGEIGGKGKRDEAGPDKEGSSTSVSFV